METTKYVPVEGGKMQTFIFTVSLEQDEEGWRAFYAPLEHLGASTWGESKEVLSMILEEFQEEGKTLPSTEGLTVTEKAAVAITR